eukprot:TRINITY_DN781859_c0_g1_i1.p1 TRINITY_DN781859_c0_g1~~TRINITY_DN781859_c0_g1_i1.p1  ORF type:complete len:163 (-),score=9.67 TRINITY_DN781859_c0_g1_i1:113-601(-)
MYFADLISKDILFSSDYSIDKFLDGIWRVKGNMISVGQDADEHRLVMDVVQEFKLKSVVLTRDAFLDHVIQHRKHVIERLAESQPERTTKFVYAASTFMKSTISRFEELRFFGGPSDDPVHPNYTLMVFHYAEDGFTPCLYVLSDAIEEVEAQIQSPGKEKK